MKAYIIYRIKYKIGDSYFDIPQFYAWTTDKSAIKRFKEERDLSQFYIKEREYTDKLREILDERRISYRLLIHKAITKDTNNPCKETYVNIQMTQLQYDKVMKVYDEFYDEMQKFIHRDQNSLKNEYRKALTILGYDQLQRMYRAYHGFGSLDNDPIKISPDEFAIYMYFYGDSYA